MLISTHYLLLCALFGAKPAGHAIRTGGTDLTRKNNSFIQHNKRVNRYDTRIPYIL